MTYNVFSGTLNPTHSLTRTKATPCVEVWQTSDLQPLRLGEEKKKEQTTGWKYIWSALLHRATIKNYLKCLIHVKVSVLHQCCFLDTVYIRSTSITSASVVLRNLQTTQCYCIVHTGTNTQMTCLLTLPPFWCHMQHAATDQTTTQFITSNWKQLKWQK